MILERNLKNKDKENVILEEKLAKQERTSKIMFNRLRALKALSNSTLIESQKKTAQGTTAMNFTKRIPKDKKQTTAAIDDTKEIKMFSSSEEGSSDLETREIDSASESKQDIGRKGIYNLDKSNNKANIDTQKFTYNLDDVIDE